jgi:predicted regulator of Ras-like GTPase activity (Roadblock/LC7/MglB family)
VQKTSTLPGVAGALIALQDGLLVANCMPPEWRSETIAAFLPQIFGRMHQYTKELKMGELQSVTFAVEKGALLIFAAGIIYFAVLSKPETSLPLHELTLIARELSRHTK